MKIYLINSAMLSLLLSTMNVMAENKGDASLSVQGKIIYPNDYCIVDVNKSKVLDLGDVNLTPDLIKKGQYIIDHSIIIIEVTCIRATPIKFTFTDENIPSNTSLVSPGGFAINNEKNTTIGYFKIGVNEVKFSEGNLHAYISDGEGSRRKIEKNKEYYWADEKNSMIRDTNFWMTLRVTPIFNAGAIKKLPLDNAKIHGSVKLTFTYGI